LRGFIVALLVASETFPALFVATC